MDVCSKMFGPRVDFEFAFDNTVFSDRVLRIEVVNPSDSGFDGLNCAPVSNGSECCEVVDKVQSLHINSVILAANSSFFHKLFTNGMKESHQNHVTLRINASEEGALMDLLKFIYNNTLNASTAADLLGVLMAADKYGVISCMTYCSELLQKLPMSLENALLYLDLPSSVLNAEPVEPLRDAAKLYLTNLYKNLWGSKERLMALPLSALMVVLSNESLQVPKEDHVCEFILNWGRAHYPNLEERREILTMHLSRVINFQYMSYSKLIEILGCPDFDEKQLSKLVFRAICLKDKDKDGVSSVGKLAITKRCYTVLPINVVPLQCSRIQRLVYFNLEKETCRILPSCKLVSDSFCLGGYKCLLAVQLSEDHISSGHFGLSVVLKKPGDCTIDCEIAVMKKPLEEFETVHKVNNCTAFTTVMYKNSAISFFVGQNDLFGVSWDELMSDNSDYFINDILHLQVKVALNE